jgi:predicted CoA-binding protein
VQTLDDASLRALLERVRPIAVVGIKEGEAVDAFRVPRYMQRGGYRILPVSPKLDTVLGAPVVRSLGELSEPPDLVNLFRAPAHIPGPVDEILALPVPPKAVWMQLGISHAASRTRLERAGVAVIEDRCLMVEHARLFGRQPSH